MEPETCSECEMMEIVSISNTTANTVGRLVDALVHNQREGNCPEITNALKAKILEQIELI